MLPNLAFFALHRLETGRAGVPRLRRLESACSNHSASLVPQVPVTEIAGLTLHHFHNRAPLWRRVSPIVAIRRLNAARR